MQNVIFTLARMLSTMLSSASGRVGGQCSCSFSGEPRALFVQRFTPNICRHARGATVIKAVGWDPEGILAPPKGGHITKRLRAKEIQNDEVLQAQIEEQKKLGMQELQAERDVRALCLRLYIYLRGF